MTKKTTRTFKETVAFVSKVYCEDGNVSSEPLPKLIIDGFVNEVKAIKEARAKYGYGNQYVVTGLKYWESTYAMTNRDFKNYAVKTAEKEVVL